MDFANVSVEDFTGKLLADPTPLSTLNNGVGVTNFVVLVKKIDHKDNTREYNIGCTAFGDLAKEICEKMKKDTNVTVSGHLNSGRLYTDKSGVERCNNTVYADRVKVVPDAQEEGFVNVTDDQLSDLPFA